MADLFADSDDAANDLSLKTENEYAKRYDAWRQKEELHKLEQKYGENPTEADLEESDSEDEDEEPPEVSEKVEKDFLKTLSLLKKKDPRIYDPTFKFFEEQNEEKEDTKETVVTEKPKKIVSSLAQAFGADDDESDGEIFKVEKPTEPLPEKEDKLKEFLTGKTEHLGDEREEDLKALKSLWSDPKLNEGEAFLRDYILNRKYLAEDEEGPSNKLLDDADLEADAATVEEQGKFERAYNFRFEEPDQEYLKRYPRTIGGTRPKDDRRARKRAETRTRKEQEKTRKMEEIARLRALKLKEIQEKIAQIKEVTGNKDLAFKDEDIEGDFDPADHDRRMAAIFNEQYYGEEDSEKPVFPEIDEQLEIEKNWDHYEEEMGIEYGNNAKGDTHCEDEDFNMDAEYDPKKARMTLLQEIQETLGKKRRNRKRKTKLAQLLAEKKPKFDPATARKTYAEYMEEYYKMDCEDVIGGDLPTRFKYREVVPNSYGLSIEEILIADDKELNKWASLKKTVKYRPEHVEKGEVKTYQIKAGDASLKKKLLPSLFKETEEPETSVETKNKKKKKKKKKKLLETIEQVSVEPSTSAATANISVEVEVTENETREKKKSKKKKKDLSETIMENKKKELLETIKQVSVEPSMSAATANISIEVEVAQNERREMKKSKNTKKDLSVTVTEDMENEETNSLTNGSTYDNLKNKLKYKNKTGIQTDLLDNTISTVNESTSMMKKKRKKKNKPNPEGSNPAADVNEKKFKRKIPAEGELQRKKIKFNPKKLKQKGINRETGNKMNNLSDERLKAYGLNPKKYRSFLKYKKF